MFNAIIPIVFSALQLASPVATPTTQVEVNRLVALCGAPLASADPCIYAPEHHPDYFYYINYPYTVPSPCPPPSYLGFNCYSQLITDYLDVIELYDNYYVDQYCLCWELYPNHTELRVACVKAAQEFATNAFKEMVDYFNEHLEDCCTMIN